MWGYSNTAHQISTARPTLPRRSDKQTTNRYIITQGEGGRPIHAQDQLMTAYTHTPPPNRHDNQQHTAQGVQGIAINLPGPAPTERVRSSQRLHRHDDEKDSDEKRKGVIHCALACPNGSKTMCEKKGPGRSSIHLGGGVVRRLGLASTLGPVPGEVTGICRGVRGILERIGQRGRFAQTTTFLLQSP